MPYLTFAAPDLTTFTGLDALDLTATGQHLIPQAATLECRIAEPDPWCTPCGAMGTPRATITRRLSHIPYGHWPTTLLLRIRCYRCTGCGRIWQEDTSRPAPARAKLTRTALDWALRALALDHLIVNWVAALFGVSWNTANTAILDEGQRRLIQYTTRFHPVTALGVHEHVWRHIRRGDKYVTVIIDLTPVKGGTGPSRLLDMVPGRSKKTFKEWLTGRPAAWRQGVEVGGAGRAHRVQDRHQ